MSIISDALKKAQEQSEKYKDKETIAPSPPEAGKHRKNKVRILSVLRVAFLVASMSVMVFVVRAYKPEISRGLSGLAATMRQNATEPADEKVVQVEAPPVTIAPAPPAIAPETHTMIKVPQKQYTLNGIAFDEASPYAVINDTILVKGDHIGEAKLISIEKNKVTLLSGDKEITLKLK